MKIVFTGGGTGGHFYPLVAVAQAINREVTEKKLVAPRLFYLASRAYDERALFETNLKFRRVPAGKRRRYFSPLNFLDTIRTGWGIIVALAQLFLIYPDLIFSKGGYDSFPTLLAARWLKIPVFIHESDAKPGRVNLWSAKFAVRIALSYAEAASYFPAAAGARIAVTGNPIREELLLPISGGAREVLQLEPAPPTWPKLNSASAFCFTVIRMPGAIDRSLILIPTPSGWPAAAVVWRSREPAPFCLKWRLGVCRRLSFPSPNQSVTTNTRTL